MSIFDLGNGTGKTGTDRSAVASEGAGRDLAETRCSRKGCRAEARWGLLWNNPRLHTPARRKVWLACPEHREWLEQYLESRGLYKETLAVEELPPDAG